MWKSPILHVLKLKVQFQFKSQTVNRIHLVLIQKEREVLQVFSSSSSSTSSEAEYEAIDCVEKARTSEEDSPRGYGQRNLNQRTTTIRNRNLVGTMDVINVKFMFGLK